jgi:serine phosphatase RsbU (regulator of sigma subunit)/anti-sigma regulatory factor (Ser/Thr protein kinase)
MPDDAAPTAARSATDDASAVLAWVVEAATQVHGPTPVQAKLEWAVETVYRLTGAEFAAVASFEGGRAKILAGVGATPDDLVEVAEDLLTEVVYRGMASRGGAGEASTPARRPSLALGARSRVRIRDRWGTQLAFGVVSANGSLHGSLLLGHHNAEFFDEHDLQMGKAVAVHLGVALDNAATVTRLAELEAAQREAAHQLQTALLPPVPSVDGAELGRYYLAADPTALTGGDLYDWVVLPNGDIHVAVVDVLGKGVAATKDALAITHALRMLVLDGCPLKDVVARADSLVTIQSPDLVATVAVGYFSPSTGRVQLAGGGHPPPVLVRRDGEVRQINIPGVPIGWPGAGSATVVDVTLDRSDTLVMYTDGLVEAGKDIVAGLAALERAVRQTASYPAAQMARLLVERALAGAERQDDALAVVLRRRVQPAGVDAFQLAPFEHRFSPNVAMVSVARHLFSDWLTAQPIDHDAVDDLLVIATELCANAVAASTGAARSVALRARAEGHALVIEAEDDGPGFAWPLWTDEEPPDLAEERGRGLFLVRALSDDVEVVRRDDRTIVRCTKRSVMGGRAAS